MVTLTTLPFDIWEHIIYNLYETADIKSLALASVVCRETVLNINRLKPKDVQNWSIGHPGIKQLDNSILSTLQSKKQGILEIPHLTRTRAQEYKLSQLAANIRKEQKAIRATHHIKKMYKL